VTLTAEKKYIAVANGVLNPEGFAANPDEKSTAFNLFVKEGVREAATQNDMVEMQVFHGASDAPSVNVAARYLAQLVDDLMYGSYTDYLTVGPESYIIDLSPGADSTMVIATFDGNLQGLAGQSVTVFASGFLAPDMNQNGEAFGLYAALANGNVVSLTALTTANIQIIHNAADPAAASVDVYVNGGRALDDFAFRTATPFIQLPGNEMIEIAVAPGSSSSVEDALKTFNVRFLAGETYVALANGVLNPDDFVTNPDGREIAFNLIVKDRARMQATMNDMVDMVVVHGATDAPGVDVYARDVAKLVDNAMYGDITEYISVPGSSYTLDITAAGDSTQVVATYNVDLTGLEGGSAVVFASGFLTPSANQNGEGFGLYAALANGDVVTFTVTSLNEMLHAEVVQNFELMQNYPNPFNPSTRIAFNLPASERVQLKIFNVLGKEVTTLVNGMLEAGRYEFTFDASNLASGIYFYRIQAGSVKATKSMVLMR
jgi:hypothetical protein